MIVEVLIYKFTVKTFTQGFELFPGPKVISEAKKENRLRKKPSEMKGL